ncbi:hypothetical protein [Croceibacter atlanticus]|uniref:hypothetical protein n=1 Tax=Croceibacter atlanticus TaxID=313588 RepID=UPI0030DC31BF|tara:strand:+ start:43978 stop:44220 length:243 start_codon:yes stop_codon:yes gene_type:complete
MDQLNLFGDEEKKLKIGKQQRAAFNAGFFEFYCKKKGLLFSVITFFKSGAAIRNFKKEEPVIYKEYLNYRKNIKLKNNIN